jgi:hypothetical protein
MRKLSRCPIPNRLRFLRRYTQSHWTTVQFRKYSEIELNLEEFSYLLWVYQGIRSISDRPGTFWNVPSAVHAMLLKHISWSTCGYSGSRIVPNSAIKTLHLPDQ